MDEVKLTITAQASETLARRVPRGKLTKAWEIEAGPVTVTRHSKAEAKAEAARQLQAWIEASDHGPIVVTYKRGHVAVLVPTPSPETDKVTYTQITSGFFHDGTPYTQHSHNSAESWIAARREALYRLVDQTVDYHDDASVAEGCKVLDAEGTHSLLRYAAWQRAYRHADTNGEADPHTWASDHSRDFIPALTAGPFVRT